MGQVSIAGIGALGELFRLDRAADGRWQQITLIHPEQPAPDSLGRAPHSLCWPAWSSDGDHLFVSTIERPDGGSAPARVLRQPSDGSSPTVLFTNPEQSALIAQGMPHYLHPSPNGQALGILASTPRAGLSQFLLPLDGSGEVRATARGAPLFSTWSPTGDALLLHAGGELVIIDPPGGEPRTLATNQVAYRVPAWSPDGERFAVVAPLGPTYVLQLMDRRGTVSQQLVPLATGAAFAWSPDGTQLAVARLKRADGPRYHDLQLVPLDGKPARSLYDGDCLLFCWSPSGEQLALLVPDARDGLVTWLVLDQHGAIQRRFPPFEPSTELQIYAAFFDQYTLTHRLWSPDGSALLALGKLRSNGTPPELQTSDVFVLELATGTVASVAAGSVAFWQRNAG